MKIIDLLNKIANGEEVPKMIKVRGEQYKIVNPAYPYMYKDYASNELEDNIHYITRCLDEEVEITEEEKEIEKLDITDRRTWEGCTTLTVEIMAKINELIDEVKKLKEK